MGLAWFDLARPGLAWPGLAWPRLHVHENFDLAIPAAHENLHEKLDFAIPAAHENLVSGIFVPTFLIDFADSTL